MSQFRVVLIGQNAVSVEDQTRVIVVVQVAAIRVVQVNDDLVVFDG
jgi:hypothetical protein